MLNAKKQKNDDMWEEKKCFKDKTDMKWQLFVIMGQKTRAT